jgi:hypothetical protein
VLPSLERALSWHLDRAAALVEGAPVAVPARTPVAEIRRSAAASEVGALASAAGLSCFHFEHRAHMALPATWVPAASPELADPPAWEAGVLPEAKYQSFRHDLPLGSFHPHHRAKWSTHELTHGLVGFAWAPDATPLFHATAGRLAELVPVVLWYFLDEATLVRCPDHDGGGALFRAFCPACERAAAARADARQARDFLAGALRFLDRELAAVARTRRLGRVVPSHWATLDLAGDGVAYAHAHGPRLASGSFRRFADAFLVRDGGWSADLDALEARAVEVAAALLAGVAPRPLTPSAAAGAARWALQDLGWRLHALTEEVPEALVDDVVHAAEPLAEALALTRAGADGLAPADAEVEAALAAAVGEAAARWSALAEEVVLPGTATLFAVGYPLPGVPAAAAAVREGLESCAPLSLLLLGGTAGAVVAAFARADADAPVRGHLGGRWATWLRAHAPSLVADLAGWEAAVSALPAAPVLQLRGAGRDAAVRLADGVTVVRAGCDVLALAERVEAGSVEGGPDGALVIHQGGPVGAAETALLLARGEDGDVVLVDVDPATADALEAGTPLLPDEAEALLALGLAVPVALAERLEAP